MRVLGLVIAFVWVASAAVAGQCGFEKCWGAVSIGPTGEWAWSTGYVVESGAVARVQNDCPGCTEIETFFNGCGAIARRPGGAWGFAWASTAGGAKGAALRYCARFGSDCTPVVAACSY